jgi:putative glycerol-1-phosphate prenyltransferase
MIKYVSSELSLPLIVGGGIKSTAQLKEAFDAGADLVVVGNIFESEPHKISEFIACTKAYGNHDESTPNRFNRFIQA